MKYTICESDYDITMKDGALSLYDVLISTSSSNYTKADVLIYESSESDLYFF